MTSPFRIEIDPKGKSSEAKVLQKMLNDLGYNLEISNVSKVYTIDYDFNEKEINKIAEALCNSVSEDYRINQSVNMKFDYALEIGFLPGVTDNVAHTAQEIIDDLLKISFGRNKVFSSKLVLINSKNLTEQDLEGISKELTNTLIERHHIKTFDKYQEDNGMDYIIPRVKLLEKPQVTKVDLNVDNEKLATLGKKGIYDPEKGTYRGPLALDLDYMLAVQAYFKKEERLATDIELESIAQTWSEHCKHTIFAAEIDDIEEGIYKKFIKSATNKIRKDLGKDDFCLSVFKDNSGGIVFDDNYLVTDKVETHNSPSALDPFGGAITGIVGVNRDTVGFGMGALPIANKYGFCVGRPEDNSIIYRGQNKVNPALTPHRILEGIIHGVNVGGNCSGIPTPQGFVYCDDSYKGKPLVFVGTVGFMPRSLPSGNLSYEKKAEAGDNIVIIGGRVGKDGIHGATFSSEVMDEASPATAVQIGDPITQKKFSDVIVKEARDRNLYNSITDNGAGGLSCSVAEMAKESGGFVVDLEKIPLKYPGLQPWEVWISESQERMTLSVPDKNLEEFTSLMNSRGVEVSVIGKFNDTDRAIVCFNGDVIFDLNMDFLHDGLPKRTLKTKPYPYIQDSPVIEVQDQESLFENLLGSHNICSFEFISKQYDHEVQANSVVKPLQGKGMVNGVASVIKPLFDSKKGVVMSQSLYPRLSEINAYDMAACAIDTAIRNAVAVGGNVDHMALLDNFCWCSSDDEKRLHQLTDAAKACYDLATIYKTPFISGKDSMFNDFKGFDEKGKPVKISALPTLLISSIGVIDDISNTCTMDFKITDDLIYVIGKTKDECGGSEFYYEYGEKGGESPKVDASYARSVYKKMFELHREGMFSACASVSVGGLLITLAKMSIAGMLGADVDLSTANTEDLSFEKLAYSETQSRFIVTINPKERDEFKTKMKDFDIFCIGQVTDNNNFKVSLKGKSIIDMNVLSLDQVYKARFAGY